MPFVDLSHNVEISSSFHSAIEKNKKMWWNLKTRSQTKQKQYSYNILNINVTVWTCIAQYLFVGLVVASFFLKVSVFTNSF